MFKKIILFFLIKRVNIYLIILTAILGGIISFFTIKKQLYSNNKYPFFNIETKYQNYSAYIIEKIITIPLEEKLSGLKNIKNIYSRSEEGKSTIFIKFNNNANYKSSLIDLYEIVDDFAKDLPSDCHKPNIYNYDPSSKPDFIYSIYSDRYSVSKIREIVENNFSYKLKKIQGVANVEIYGGNLKEIKIIIKEKFLLLDSNIHSFVNKIIKQNNDFLFAGEKFYNNRIINFYIDNRINNINEIKNLPIKFKNKIVPLKDLADISVKEKNPQTISRFNNKKDVGLVIFVNKNSSILSTGKKVEQKIKQLKNKLNDKNLKIKEVYNKYKIINSSLNSLYKSLITGIVILFLFTIFTLKNIYYSFIIILSIPFSVFFMLIILNLTGKSINLYAIIGTAVGTGMLVDSSLAVMENIINEKKMTIKNIFRKTIEILKPVIIGILTSIIIFLPVIFAPLKIKLLFSDIALTIFISLVFSGIFAFLIMPGLIYNKINKKNRELKYKFISLDFKKYYKPVISFSFNNKKIILFVFIFLFVLIMFFISISNYDIKEYSNDNKIYLRYEFDSGIKPDKMDSLTKNFVNTIKNKFHTIDSVYYKISKYVSDITIILNNNKNKQQTIKQIDKFLKKFRTQSGFIHLDDASLSASNSKSVKLELLGQNYDKINSVLKQFVNNLQGNKFIKNIYYNYRNDFEKKEFILDKTFLSSHNINISDIVKYLNMKFNGYVSEKMIIRRKNIFRRDILISGYKGKPDSLEEILNTDITINNKKYKISSFIKVKTKKTFSGRMRKNNNKYLSLTIESINDISLSEFINRIKTKINNFKLPDRYYFQLEDSGELSTLIKFIVFYFFLIFFLIYFVSASVYKSFTQPFILFISMIVTLFVPLIYNIIFYKNNFDFPFIVALSVIAGLSINNITILKDEISKNKNKNLLEKVITGVNNKKNAVFLSSFSTIFALIPGAFSGNYFYSRLSETLIIGIFWNVIYSVFIYPVLDKYEC